MMKTGTSLISHVSKTNLNPARGSLLSSLCRCFFVWAVLFLSQSTIAADMSVEIVLSTRVQDVLGNVPSVQNKRLKTAIRVGNKVITRILDRSIFIDDDKWPERTGSLLGMTGAEFNQMISGWGGGNPSLLVCPNVRLVELLEAENGEVEISYQSVRMGELISEGTQFNSPMPSHPYSQHYSAVRKGELHQTKLYLNAKHKLINAIPQDQITPTFYRALRSGLDSANSRKPIYIGETNELVQFRVASYEQAINEMEQAASDICKSTPNITTKE